MTRARTLADMISDGVIGTTELADDAITPVKLDETGTYQVEKLGIGTAPLENLTIENTHISDAGNNSFLRHNMYWNGSALAITNSSYGTSQIGLNRHGGGHITFETGAVNTAASEKMRLNQNGNLGIGLTSSAMRKVHIADPSHATIRMDDTGGTAGGAMNTMVEFYAGGVFGGNVGFGTGGGYMALNNDRGPTVFNTNNSSGSASRVNAILYNTSNVFNENGEDLDFRVESDSETHMLFVDAANNRVGIGTNGPSSTLSVDGDILSNWGNSGYQKIGIAGRTANVFSTTGRTLILTGADAIAGPQAMAGGDVIVRGGKGRANTGLNTYAGHLYLEGGEHTTSGETGGAGNVYIRTAGQTRGSFYAGGDIALSTNNFSQFFKLDHSTNQIMIGQTLSNDAELLTLGSAGQATYSSGASEGMLGLVRFNNTGNSNQHSGLFFRVTSNNGSNNSNASIGLKQPSSGSHNSQFYFNLRSQSQNRFSQYGLIDSENGWIFNDGSDSYNDFRVESDNDTHALFVNSGSNRLGIFESSGENTVNISVSGSSSHTSGSLPPGITLYANNSNDGTGNAITWKDATGAQGVAGIASFRTGQYGGYGRDLRFYVNDTASTNAYQEGMRLNEEQMLSTRTVGWSVNSLVEPTVVAASEASGSGSIYIDYYLDSSGNQWSTAHFFCTISEIDGGASGNAAAWYLVRCHHYNGGVGFSVRDSGGDTASFTTAFTDSGGTDPIAVRVGFTGLSGTAVLNVMGANYFGVEKVV